MKQIMRIVELNNLHTYINYKLYFLEAYNEYKKYNGSLYEYFNEIIGLKGLIKINKTNSKIIKEIDNNNIINQIDTQNKINIDNNIINQTNTQKKNIKENNNDNIIYKQSKIIKNGRKHYYLINNKLYKVKKDKSLGKLFGSYIDGKIIEDINNNKIKNKINNEVDNIKVSNKKKSKTNIIINNDTRAGNF